MAVFERKKRGKEKKSSEELDGKGAISAWVPVINSHAEVSVGKVRKHNEDAVFAMNTLSLSADQKTSLGLFIVADGMGGHENGELASSLAVEAVVNVLQQQLFNSIQQTHKLPAHEEVEYAVRSAAQSAQQLC